MSSAARHGWSFSVGTLVIGQGAPTITFLVYLFFWLLYLDAPASYQALLVWLGVPLGPYPFFDLDAVLTAIECARRGVDVTLPNACMGGGLFQYSPLLLKAGALGLGAAQRVPVGLGLDLVFVLSLFALPRPRRWSEFWLVLLAMLSSSTLWAMESANIDVALYLLVLGGVHLLLRGRGVRLVGYATLLGAATIKFYPACLMVLAAPARPVRFMAITLAGFAAAMLLAVAFRSELSHVLPHLPQGSVGVIFSASCLPLGLASLVSGGDGDHGIGLAMRVGSTIILIGVCATMTRRLVPAILPGFRALPQQERILLVAGAVSITFCFLAARNFMYREIFLLLTLPGLWELERGAPTRALGARFRLASRVVVGLQWSTFFQMGLVRITTEPLVGLRVVAGIWVLRELLWWWLVSLFVSIILCFLCDAPVLAGWRPRVAA